MLNSSRTHGRALIAVGPACPPVVLATDHPGIVFDIDSIDSYQAEDLGLVRDKDLPFPGLYLWEGASHVAAFGPDYEPEVVYEGKVTRLLAADPDQAVLPLDPAFVALILDALKMEPPPEPEPEFYRDGESPGEMCGPASSPVDSRQLEKPGPPAKEAREVLNKYTCPDCGHTWHEVWISGRDSKCQVCELRNVSPVQSTELT